MREVDLVIRNARLIDGTGAPARDGGIAIDGERIAALGDVSALSGRQEIDARGKALSPGFIDVHTHDDRALLATPEMAFKVSQGVTTVVTGNCGISLAPLPASDHVPPPLDLIADTVADLYPRMRDYFAALADDPPAVNAVPLVGHSTLRIAAMDRLDRPATKAETRVMRDALDRALEDGAVGLSTGLYYPTASASSTEEVIAVSEPLKRHGAIYTTHLRDESDRIVDAMEEAFAIGRAADVPVLLSHHKVTNPRNHGRTRETLALYEKRAKEQPLALDVYPYAASSTILEAKRASQVDRILVAWSKARPEMAGRLLSDIAAEWAVTREEAVERLLPAGAVYFTMDEEDVRRVLAFPETMVGSDGLPHDQRPHPRLWGTFPRVLGHYVRNVKLFGLEEAVRRMTSLAAGQFGLVGRGRLEAGAVADLVLFDPDTIIDRADFDEPTRLSEGVESVFVGGSCVWRNGATTGARPGRVLRRGGH